MFELLSRPATEVAPLLLGAVVRVGEVAVRLTEVEAYMGEVDPGSHAFRGPGKRNAVMYGPPGHLYTYFTYGMHTCANVVCMPEGVASGILLRAGEVIEGVDVAAERRATSKKPADLAMGPARLAVALSIRLDDAGTNLQTGRVRLELPQSPSPFAAGPRTGVAGAGGTDEYPWRFWIPGEPSVSPYRAAVKRKRS
ncbi:DNA-3-methyladenine glycosylase [Salinibacterium sp. UTAS2018]|uniref:DNA-3-methyladenine glycosylase n=1 Tax=Salinibacterium sp. UTAS2018 TaxID=2508880 RepID=UPI0010097357|nr:DNA-3-methyladenine glycosylase [Salinibacterium sp. UTAS2018]QAV68967.1 DNA-3-methyladenine glycosylase [Salinibacterium sp. UTAS2018]